MPTTTEPHVPLVDAYDTDKLPESFRMLLAPEVPIPSSALFFPRHRTWTSVIVTLVASSAAILFGLVLFVVSLLWNDATVGSSSSFSWLATLGGGLALGGGLWLASVRTKVRGLLAQRAGTPLRYGLFLTREGLLERRDVGFTMVPRERIRDIHLDESWSARVVFTEPDGRERNLSLARDLGDPKLIVEAIRRAYAM